MSSHGGRRYLVVEPYLMKALAVMTLPQNIKSSVTELHRLSDEMWYLAGDTSVDFSWYTKRATLSAVYASTGYTLSPE